MPSSVLRPTRFAVLIVLYALALLTQAPARAFAAAAEVACRISVSSLAEGIRLDALAEARMPIAGAYRLAVAKHSATGSSQNVQSGEFDLDAGQQKILATVVLDRSAAGHYNAVLTLEFKSGHESCRSP